MANELRVCTEMMLEGPELVIRDPMNSLVGVAMMGLLESQANYQVCMCHLCVCVCVCVYLEM